MVQDILRLLRPQQWLKNLFVLAPLFFAGQVPNRAALLASLTAAGLFCLLSSSVYAFNDICDRRRDQAHQLKRNRPLAAGRVPLAVAGGLSLALAATSLAGAWVTLGAGAGRFMLVYLGLNAAYSLWLKRLPVIDALCVAAGFILRVMTGGAAAGVPVSPWLMLMTVALALLMVFGKRRHELLLVGQDQKQREALDGYSREFLNHAIAVLTTLTLICYLLYCLEAKAAQALGPGVVLATAVWALYGLLRYLNLVFTHGRGGDPVRLLINDPPLMLAGVGWAAHWAVLLYWP